jgi:hypothetical protein
MDRTIVLSITTLRSAATRFRLSSPLHPFRSKRFILCLLCGCLFVAIAGYLCTGTMAPYAAIHPRPLILKPCNYLLNPDNPHFVASFKMLSGAPRDQWDFSVVLRRTLFPLLAFPLMKLWGFLIGGVATSLILQVLAFATFTVYVRRRIGPAAGIATCALLATYPGIYFWCGLPYCYAIIVPATLTATICAREIDLSPALPRACLFAVFLGILFTGYDLLVYFAPAVVVILLLKRRWLWLVPVIVLMLLPEWLNKFLLVHVAGLNFDNENSRLYMTILTAYAHPPAIATWARHVSPVFESFFKVYFFSNFTFLPALFLVAIAGNLLLRRRGISMEANQRWVLLSGLGLFLLINLAPPYRGWQFRGYGMARIYQPVFGVMLLYIAQVVQRFWDERLGNTAESGTGREMRPASQFPPPPVGRGRAGVEVGAGARSLALLASVGAVVLVNASIALGPITLNPLAGWAYNAFYHHADQPQLLHNLALFGRRPLGFCNRSIKIQNPPPRHHGPKKLTRAQRQRLHARQSAVKPTSNPAAGAQSSP